MEQQHPLFPFVPDYYVYTDGSCVNNGKPNAKAGMGIYFGENDPRNVSRHVEGKQSNNTGELGAIVTLYDIVAKDVANGKKIVIVTDSDYSIRCLTTFGAKCDKKQWKEDIPNKELVQHAYTLYHDQPNIRFFHIRSHTGKQDVHSLGNEKADQLANLAVGKLENDINQNHPKKIYLNVLYEDKEEAKQLGAKWDPTKKKWYTLSTNPHKEEVIDLFA